MKKIACILFSLCWTLALAAQNNQPLPEVTLNDLNGALVKTNQFAKNGKVTIIVFWATWSSPSKTALSKISKLYEKWKDKGLEVIAVSTDDARSKNKVKPEVIRNGWTFLVACDDGKLQQKVNPTATSPYTLVADKNGKIVYTRGGYNEGDELQLEEQLKALLPDK